MSLFLFFLHGHHLTASVQCYDLLQSILVLYLNLNWCH